MSTQNQQKDKSIADLRIDYSQASLSEADTAADPITQFGRWFDEAMRAEVPEANAMSLATVGSNGRPSSRIVLIKQFDEHGFTWFTNYESRKGHDLEEHPHGALLFHWIALERQVRIEGRVEKSATTRATPTSTAGPCAAGSAPSLRRKARSSPVANYWKQSTPRLNKNSATIRRDQNIGAATDFLRIR